VVVLSILAPDNAGKQTVVPADPVSLSLVVARPGRVGLDPSAESRAGVSLPEVWTAFRLGDMAEQFLVAFAVDHGQLRRVVGSADAALSRRALARRTKVGELNELFEEYGFSVREALDQVLSGKLETGRAGEYRRLLELLGPLLGRAIAPREIVLPGRGWHEIGPWMPRWGLPRLARVWGRQDLFPWKRRPRLGAASAAGASRRGVQRLREENALLWPVARFIPASELPALTAELKGFSRARVVQMPERQAGLEEEVLHLARGLAAWVRRARALETDLIVLHDGQC